MTDDESSQLDDGRTAWPAGAHPERGFETVVDSLAGLQRAPNERLDGASTRLERHLGLPEAQ